VEKLQVVHPTIALGWSRRIVMRRTPRW
jgi:hypothetical protein